jgi:pimeloyl-ACP methyl ester carboxylesterase
MTFLGPLRALFTLISLAILSLSVYLIWTGYQRADEGDPGLDPAIAGEGDTTRLWIGYGLLALSFLGRWIWPLLLARGDKPEEKVRLPKGEVRTVTGPDGSRLHVESFGPKDGPVLVFTHGWGLDHSVWRYAVRDLAKRFRVVVWDLPGLGKSTQPSDGKYQLDRLAENLRAVLNDTAGGQPAVLVGHSIGGMTTQTLAALRPEILGEQVRGLVLVNTTHLRPIETTAVSGLVKAIWPIASQILKLQTVLGPVFQLAALQSYQSGQAHLATRIGGFGKHVTRSQLDHTSWLASRNSQAVQAKGDFAMMDWDITSQLPRINVPTLVITGDKDLLTRPDAGETITKLIPGARNAKMPGCGHMGFYEYAQGYHQQIGSFADSVLGQGGAPVQGTMSLTPA